MPDDSIDTRVGDIAPAAREDRPGRATRGGLCRGWWLILLVAIALGIVAGVLAERLDKPRPSAAALLRISAPSPLPGASTQQQYGVDPQRYVDTAVTELKTAGILDALDGAISDNTTVEAVAGTDLIRLVVSAPSTERASANATRAADYYREQVGRRIHGQIERRLAANRRTLQTLRSDSSLRGSDEIAGLRRETADLETIVDLSPAEVAEEYAGVRAVGQAKAVPEAGMATRLAKVLGAGLLAGLIALAVLAAEAAIRRGRASG